MEYRTEQEGTFCYPWHFPIGGSIFFPTKEDYSPGTEHYQNSPAIPIQHRTELTDRVYE